MSPPTVPTRSTSLNGPPGAPAGSHSIPGSGAGPPPRPADLVALLTDDLFLGSYLVAEGARLAGIEVESFPGRGRVVSFVIEGPSDELSLLESAYARGEALTNVLRFKSALTHLKDVMFARLRDETRGEERCRLRPRSSQI